MPMATSGGITKNDFYLGIGLFWFLGFAVILNAHSLWTHARMRLGTEGVPMTQHRRTYSFHIYLLRSSNFNLMSEQQPNGSSTLQVSISGATGANHYTPTPHEWNKN
jgi:hypothetical protein